MNAVQSSALVVDDVEELRALITQCLDAAGYRTTCVVDGAVAKTVLRDAYFDLVVTDVLMPNVDGVELIQQVKKQFPTTRILAITGGGHGLDREYCVGLARSIGAHRVPEVVRAVETRRFSRS